MKTMLRLAAAGALILLAGCATVGHDFESTDLGWLKAGETGKKAILDKMGEPFRVGVDQGDQTWTYGYYRYSLLRESQTKDLVIRFTADGKVKSYTLNTSFPEDKEILEPALRTAPDTSATSP